GGGGGRGKGDGRGPSVTRWTTGTAAGPSVTAHVERRDQASHAPPRQNPGVPDGVDDGGAGAGIRAGASTRADGRGRAGRLDPAVHERAARPDRRAHRALS